MTRWIWPCGLFFFHSVVPPRKNRNQQHWCTRPRNSIIAGWSLLVDQPAICWGWSFVHSPMASWLNLYLSLTIHLVSYQRKGIPGWPKWTDSNVSEKPLVEWFYCLVNRKSNVDQTWSLSNFEAAPTLKIATMWGPKIAKLVYNYNN